VVLFQHIAVGTQELGGEMNGVTFVQAITVLAVPAATVLLAHLIIRQMERRLRVGQREVDVDVRVTDETGEQHDYHHVVTAATPAGEREEVVARIQKEVAF
jgi:hypothetical protein